MIGRRTGLTAFVVVLIALATYGILSTPKPRDVAAIGAVDAFVCALPQDVGGFLAAVPLTFPGPARPLRGTVPDSFEPVEAVVCDVNLGPHVEADGTVTYFERHYAGNFESAIEEFNAPSARTPIFDAGCASYSGAPLTDMWLVDAHGQAMEPSYPLSDCGFDSTRGLHEVLELAEIDSAEHRLRIDVAGISLFFSCLSVMKPPTPGPHSLLDLPWFPSGFCRFDTSGPDPKFLGADVNDVASSPDFSGALPDLQPAGPCTEQATSIATTSSAGSISTDWMPVEIHVELDGCRRVLADGYVPLVAPQALLDAIERSAR
ncbi:hypothetical protein QMK17_24950 [Rhodococcus sp. G-MC3]|uniref:hypothetical protein n=1 Tax=Rhodococcus sp. G-MC3 TaxID=3046209 RepID=UPI0024B8C6CC|nr:hypothetical protein [Rhodococcus sp. G-MC3]MDJ0396554.1 hypothetical protein [Rhodococcus sp. G-MC3]